MLPTPCWYNRTKQVELDVVKLSGLAGTPPYFTVAVARELAPITRLGRRTFARSHHTLNDAFCSPRRKSVSTFLPTFPRTSRRCPTPPTQDTQSDLEGQALGRRLWCVSSPLLLPGIVRNTNLSSPHHASGAGISVQAGIPDFRSPTGLFHALRRDNPKEALTSGKDLFDASVFNVSPSLHIVFAIPSATPSMSPACVSTTISHLHCALFVPKSCS